VARALAIAALIQQREGLQYATEEQGISRRPVDAFSVEPFRFGQFQDSRNRLYVVHVERKCRSAEA
jgi:hypothetical protein